MLSLFVRLVARRPELGASAAEYGILVSAVAAAVVAILFVFGGSVLDVFQSSCDHIGTVAAHQSC